MNHHDPIEPDDGLIELLFWLFILACMGIAVHDIGAYFAGFMSGIL